NLDEASLLELGERTKRATEAARNLGRITMTEAASKAWEVAYPDLSADRPERQHDPHRHSSAVRTASSGGPNRHCARALAQDRPRQVRVSADRRSAGRDLVGNRREGSSMTIPKYLEAFRRAAQEAQTREKSEVCEIRGGGKGLNSLTS